MRVLFPSMSPDGLKVKPKPLPAGRGQTRLQPFEHAHLQPIPSWFHFNAHLMYRRRLLIMRFGGQGRGTSVMHVPGRASVVFLFAHADSLLDTECRERRPTV